VPVTESAREHFCWSQIHLKKKQVPPRPDMSGSGTSENLPHADTRSASQLEEELAAPVYHFPENLNIFEQPVARVASRDRRHWP
jgi:hypothetical protein